MTDELSKVSGQIFAIDYTKRTVVIRSYDEKKFEITTPLKWSPGLDAKMQKNKERYFVTCVYIGEMIEDCQYFQKPADWPQQGNKGGGQNWQPKKPRVTIAATVNLQNYENIKVEVEGNSAEESTKILIDTLNGFATNPAYSTTRDLIQSYMVRVLNIKPGGK